MATTVTVYEGPKECEDKEKVMKGNHLKMHYTGTIDESSPTGEKKKEFESAMLGTIRVTYVGKDKEASTRAICAEARSKVREYTRAPRTPGHAHRTRGPHHHAGV